MSNRYTIRMALGMLSGLFFMSLTSAMVRHFDGPHWAAVGFGGAVGAAVVCSVWIVAVIKDRP